MTLARLPWPRPARAGALPLRLALLADAHLQDGDASRPEAQSLARAVAEIRAMRPAPDLALFAGDLADQGASGALALGKEILSDVPAPLLMVRGEGDSRGQGAATWEGRFGEAKFSHTYRGINIIGLDAVWTDTGQGRAFVVGEAGRRFLAQELRGLDSELPLLVLSHAPLAGVFRPWGQWTADAGAILPLLARFRRVICLHGHVHNAVVSGQWSVVRNFQSFPTENRKPETENRLSIPATCWPLPLAIQGTPPYLTPGLGPRGCGWCLLTLGPGACEVQPRLWLA